MVDLLVDLVAVGLAEVELCYEVHVEVEEHEHITLNLNDLFWGDGTMSNLFGYYSGM